MELFLTNLTSPPLLFFLLGAAAALFRTDLVIPDQISKFLSLYLLMAIGFKGGVALAASEWNLEMLTGLGVALLMSALVPFYVFYLLKRSMSVADAAAIAATFGSISAVTFVTTTSYLDSNGVEWNGYMVAAMALMESPAIIIGLLLYRLYQSDQSDSEFDIKELVRDSFLNGSVFLIVGSLVVGLVASTEGKAQVEPFLKDLFLGILCLFLLDMGIVAMRRLKEMRRTGASSKRVRALHLVFWGLLLPLINAAVVLPMVILLGIPEGDAVLLVVLSASGSYIAVPAAMRLALPEANPGNYLGISLAVTFPFNLIVGIPLYHFLVQVFI